MAATFPSEQLWKTLSLRMNETLRSQTATIKTFASNPLADRAPVSVVIPCYNCRDTIVRAVQSVAAQTLVPQQIILVDDASTDESLDIMRNLVTSHPGWIKIIELSENQGPGTARNIGWEASSSPLIAFLDADNAWFRKKIEIQHAWMAANPTVSLTGHPCPWRPHLLDWPASPANREATRVSSHQLLFSSLLETSSIMVRREAHARFPAGRYYGEDQHLLLQMAYSQHEMFFLPMALARHYKPTFGVAGLSSQLWAMEKGHLENYADLLKHQKIGTGLFVLAVGWSLAKYLRRVVVTSLRRL